MFFQLLTCLLSLIWSTTLNQQTKEILQIGLRKLKIHLTWHASTLLLQNRLQLTLQLDSKKTGTFYLVLQDQICSAKKLYVSLIVDSRFTSYKLGKRIACKMALRKHSYTH